MRRLPRCRRHAAVDGSHRPVPFMIVLIDAPARRLLGQRFGVPFVC